MGQPDRPLVVTLGVKKEPKPALPTALRHDLTEAQLIDQLFNRTDGIVGLGELVHRVVGQVYSQLEQLTEVLPSKEDYERKQLLVKFVEESRKRLVRLLVVAKWSAHARYIKRAQDVLGFLEQQTGHLSGTVDGVEAIRQQLTDVRLRNFDIATALDVLTTGSYHGPPAIIEQQMAGPERLPDELVHSTMIEVEEMLRYRLAVEEDVPIPMRRYSIADGKAHFVVSDLFEVVLTLTGEEHDPWLCLEVELLPKSGPPGKQMKDEIIRLARQKMETSTDLPPDQLDRPLRRLYHFLRDLSLDVRLERMATEASKLAAEAWRGTLSITLSREERSLTISYWINAVPSAPLPKQPLPANQQRPAPPVPPRLVIAAKKRKATTKAILEAVADDAPEMDVDLAWIWEPQDLPLVVPTWETLSSDAVVAQLLDKVTRSHMDALCRHVIRHVLDVQPVGFQDISRTPLAKDDLLYGFRERVHYTFELDVVIEQHSGRFRLQPQAELSSTLINYIQGLEGDVNGLRDRFGLALSQIRALTTIEDIELQASLAGLAVVKILSLRQSDQDRIGASYHVVLLLSIAGAAPYYLLAIAHPILGPRFAVASMAVPGEDNPSWSITDLAWLQTPSMVLMTRVSVDQLLDYHRYAAIRVAHLRLEQQLASRLLPYERRAAKQATSNLLDSFPVVAIRLDDLLPGAIFAHRVIAIRAEYRSSAKPCRLAFYLRLVKVAKGLASELPESCELDAATRMLVARFVDDEDEVGGGALPAFFELLSLLARVTNKK